MRVVLGLACLWAGVYFRSWWAIALAVGGVALLGNAAVGVCGLYHLLGISTLKGKK